MSIIAFILHHLIRLEPSWLESSWPVGGLDPVFRQPQLLFARRFRPTTAPSFDVSQVEPSPFSAPPQVSSRLLASVGLLAAVRRLAAAQLVEALAARPGFERLQALRS